MDLRQCKSSHPQRKPLIYTGAVFAVIIVRGMEGVVIGGRD